MKTLYKLLMTLLIGSVLISDSKAQGWVAFSNAEGIVCSRAFGEDQITPLEGERYQAQLWYRLAGTSDSFIPHPETFEFLTDSLAGFIKSNAVKLAEAPGGSTIDAQVRVWDTQSGDSWETATLRFSSNVVQTIAWRTGPPGILIGLEFTSLQIHLEADGFSFTWPDQQLCEKTYQLEWAEEIDGPWTAVEEPAELIGGRWQVTIENPELATRYFRLRLLE